MEQSDTGNHNPRVGGSSPSSATINQELSDGESERFTDDCKLAALSEQAFRGAAAYLRDCADACDFTVDRVWPRAGQVSFVGKRTYFIGGEHGPIKIGISCDPLARLWILQTAYPEELFIYAVMNGDNERALHSEFSADRLRGEWFRRTDRLLRRIIHIQRTEPTHWLPLPPTPRGKHD